MELFALGYSPWSEKARWALDHYRVPYLEHEFLPIIGEAALRVRLKQLRGAISVPLLIDGEQVFRDSLDIAHHARQVGESTIDLFPAAHEHEIAVWNASSEAALSAARVLVSSKVLEDPAAKREALPSMPSALHALMSPLANLGVAHLRRKYSYRGADEQHRQSLEQVLQSLQAALADGRPYLLGDAFSYADVCMAVTLQCVRPVTDEFIALGPATRLAWSDERLASRFRALLDWRDELYQGHRVVQKES